MHPLRRRLGLVGPPRLHRVGALLRHGVRRGAGAAGIGEDVHIRKGALLDKGHGLRLVGLGLPGKAGDQVAGQGAAGEIPAQQRRPLVEEGGVIFAVHGFQGPVAAGLEGQVEVPAELAGGRGAAAEILGDHRGLQGTQADAHVPRLGRHRLDHVGKAGSARQVHPIGGHLDAGEHQLPVALLPDARRLGGGVGQRQAPQAAPGVGDDAVGAEVDAAVLDLQHGPGAAVHGPRGQLFQAPAQEGLVDAPGPLPLRHGLLHRRHEVHPVSGAEKHAGADLLGVLGAQLGVAAADRHHRAGVFVPQAADGLAGFAPALGGDGAGVDDHRVRHLAGGGGQMPVLLEPGLHGLGLKLVDLAAESGYNVSHKKSPCERD